MMMHNDEDALCNRQNASSDHGRALYQGHTTQRGGGGQHGGGPVVSTQRCLNRLNRQTTQPGENSDTTTSARSHHQENDSGTTRSSTSTRAAHISKQIPHRRRARADKDIVTVDNCCENGSRISANSSFGTTATQQTSGSGQSAQFSLGTTRSTRWENRDCPQTVVVSSNSFKRPQSAGGNRKLRPTVKDL